MTTTTASLPADRFPITETARATVDGVEWVVYSDGTFTSAVTAQDFDAETTFTDYSLWCSATTAAGDADLCARIARAAELPGIHAAGVGVWVVAVSDIPAPRTSRRRFIGEIRADGSSVTDETPGTSLDAVETASELRRHLSSIGVEGAAQDALVKETGPARHALRVKRASDAAMAAARDFLRLVDLHDGESPDIAGDYNPGAYPAMAAALCALELAGVGGRDGVEGLGTDRMAWASSLGKGRKQATDGGAWTSAIDGALRGFIAGDGYTSGLIARAERQPDCGGPIDRPMLSFFVESSEPSPSTPSVGIYVDAVPQSMRGWFLTLCRDGLRTSLSQPSWLGLGTHPTLPTYRGDAGDWAAVVNALSVVSDAAQAAS